MENAKEVKFLDRASPPHLFTLVLLAGVSAMSMSIFLPSLPAMTQEFGTSYGLMQLSVSLYLAFTALAQFLIGPISDKYGRRPIVLGALGLFTVASIGCAFANSVEVFLFFRMLQAVVAVTMALSRSI
ncbi:MAG: MFS transporter, partial [Litoreibacter sp.]|nr:MFS transporter [Litoreibacter sp.]